MTIQEAAQQALDVQDACNLSGVAHTFSNICLNVLWPEARHLNQGTDWVNQHPIVTLFLDKLASLNRTQCLCPEEINHYSHAASKVEALARGENL